MLSVVTLFADQVIAVPARATPAIDDYGVRLTMGIGPRLAGITTAVRGRLGR